MIHTLTIEDQSYVVTGTYYLGFPTIQRVIFGHNINLSKRAAGQLARGFAKVDPKSYSGTRAIMAKTARKAGILAPNPTHVH